MIRQWKISNALNRKSGAPGSLRGKDREFYETQQYIARAMQEPADEPLPERMHEQIMNAVRNEDLAESETAPNRQSPLLVAACVACALLAAGIAVLPRWTGEAIAPDSRVEQQFVDTEPVTSQINAAIVGIYEDEFKRLQQDLEDARGFLLDRFEPLTALGLETADGET